MKTLFVYGLLAGSLLTHAVRAQNGAQSKTAKPEPKIDLITKADGKPADNAKGIPAGTQKLDFTASLSAESRQQFPDLQPQAVIKSAWVSLARGTRRVATQFWQAGEPLSKVAKEAKPGDRYVIEFDLAARRKDGKLMPLTTRPIQTIALY